MRKGDLGGVKSSRQENWAQAACKQKILRRPRSYMKLNPSPPYPQEDVDDLLQVRFENPPSPCDSKRH